MAIIGNTVVFEGKFYLENTLTDPEDGTIYFTTYTKEVSDSKKIESIQLTSANKIETGVYRIEYVIPPPPVDMIYEFKGTIAGKPSLAREVIERSYT
jgi:hypothetical protein